MTTTTRRHAPVSEAFDQKQVRRTGGRAPSPPLTVSEALTRLQNRDPHDQGPVLTELVDAMLREPTAGCAVVLARLSEGCRSGGSEALADWLDRQVDRILQEAQRSLAAEVMRHAVVVVTEQLREAMTREWGEGRMREIDALIAAKKFTNLQNTGGTS